VTTERPSPGLTRRRTLTGTAAVGLGAPLLAACGGDSSSGADGAAGSDGPTAAAGTALTKTADVPEGGGTVLADQKVVVTQPAGGEFKCFSAVCPHQGCLVSKVENGSIDCMCHGSRFSIEDGSVQQGPATSPLGQVDVTVRGGEVRLA
jgi:nitrite reductase/ring-hydroxylating ferredoxin subunit